MSYYYVEDLEGEGVSGYTSLPFDTEEEARAHAQKVEPELFRRFPEHGTELHIIRDHDWDSGDCGIVVGYGRNGITKYYALITNEGYTHRLDADGNIVKTVEWGDEDELEFL